jgi:hypothetical protein
MAADEAKIEQTDEGAVFVLGLVRPERADMAWMRDDKGGEWMDFGNPEGEFQQYGMGVHVLHPGR